MHPEIRQEKPGHCPKCGMKLVLETFKKSTIQSAEKTTWKSYTPLIVILKILLLTVCIISYKDFQAGNFLLSKTISYCMIGFFLTFSTFKLMDLSGFAEGYSTYDLLAKKWFGYGYIYPFLELLFGLAMILLPASHLLLIIELVVMVFSGLGVAIKLAKHEKFQCACLGTFLKVPLTKITLVEDFGMAGLALLMLFLR